MTTRHVPDPTERPTVSVTEAAVTRHVPDSTDTPTVSVPHAGVMLGIGRCAAYEAAHTGELPTIRIGRRLLVPTAALRTMLRFDHGPDAA